MLIDLASSYCRFSSSALRWGQGGARQTRLNLEMVIFHQPTCYLYRDGSEAVVKINFLYSHLILSISRPMAAQQTTGSVCVPARVDDPFWKEPATLPDGQINSHGLRVRIDKRPATAWPNRKSLKIDKLDRKERHLLVVFSSDGKPIESVRFRFSEVKSAGLCMTCNEYPGLGLQESTRRTPWCKCH